MRVDLPEYRTAIFCGANAVVLPDSLNIRAFQLVTVDNAAKELNESVLGTERPLHVVKRNRA